MTRGLRNTGPHPNSQVFPSSMFPSPGPTQNVPTLGPLRPSDPRVGRGRPEVNPKLPVYTLRNPVDSSFRHKFPRLRKTDSSFCKEGPVKGGLGTIKTPGVTVTTECFVVNVHQIRICRRKGTSTVFLFRCPGGRERP